MNKLFFKILFLFTFGFWLSACSVETEPINYGSDICSFCKMTIMDKRFGTEFVTHKGKVFKFDDAGCMVKYMKSSSTDESACEHIVMSSYKKSAEFIPYGKAFFVKSETLQSPMLGNVAAFSSELEAQQFMKTDSNSKSVVWTELKDLF